jgi:hypothetical protein
MNIPPMENVMRIRGLLWLSQPTHPYAKLIMFGLLRHSLVAMSPTASAQSGPRGAILPWRRLSSHVIVKARCIDSWCPKGGGEHRRVAGTPCMHDSGAPSGQQGETTLWYGGGGAPGASASPQNPSTPAFGLACHSLALFALTAHSACHSCLERDRGSSLWPCDGLGLPLASAPPREYSPSVYPAAPP